MYLLFVTGQLLSIFLGAKHENELLRAELLRAQKELVHVQGRICHLEKKIAENALNEIQKRIDFVQSEVALFLIPMDEEQRQLLFHEERRQLVEIIKEIPAYAPQAQAVLDQILSLITQIYDQLPE